MGNSKNKRNAAANSRLKKRFDAMMSPPTGPGYDDICRLYAAIGPDLAKQLNFFYTAVGPGYFRNSLFTYVEAQPTLSQSEEWHLISITDCDPSLFLGTSLTIPNLAKIQMVEARRLAAELDDLRLRVKGIVVVWVMEIPEEVRMNLTPYMCHAWHENNAEVTGVITSDGLHPITIPEDKAALLLKGGAEAYPDDLKSLTYHLARLAEGISPKLLGLINEHLRSKGSSDIEPLDWMPILGDALTSEGFATNLQQYLRTQNRTFLDNLYTILSSYVGVLDSMESEHQAELSRLSVDHSKRMTKFKFDLEQLRIKNDQASARHRDLQLQNQLLRKQLNSASSSPQVAATLVADRSVGETLDRFFTA